MAAAQILRKAVVPLARAWHAVRSIVSTRDRYILRNYGHAYIVCAISFIGLYVGAEVLGRIKKFLEPHGIPLWQVFLKYYAVMVPVAYTYYLGPVLTVSAGMFA